MGLSIELSDRELERHHEEDTGAHFEVPSLESLYTSADYLPVARSRLHKDPADDGRSDDSESQAA